MDLSNYITVLPIVVICYLAGLLCKAIEKLPDKMIPVILGIVGGIVAVPAFYVMPGFPSEDLISAVSIGIVSGLASVGANQVYKQTRKKS